MKELRNDALALACLSFAGGAIITISISTIIAMGESITRLENAPKQQVFVWNDDEESMPNMGSTVKLEFIENDTIYIGPNDEINLSEYQFVVTDDSLSVSDFGRPVGTVKIEGELKKLIEQDNE